jgi:small-conductance mechanosensitive channel
VWILRLLLLRGLRRVTLPSDRVTLRLMVQVKRGSLALVLFGLIFIWAAELREMALSVTAILVAIVIATKEVILCVMGAIMRASSGSFVIGDRIEVGGARGDVIDHGLLSTTILEIGAGHQWTGRTLTIPNSMFLTTPIVNETESHHYVLHVIDVPVLWAPDWRQVEAALVDAAREISEPYLDQARRAIEMQAARQGLGKPSVEPRVHLTITEPGKLLFVLRMPCSARDKGDVEQQVLRRFLDVLRERELGSESRRGLLGRLSAVPE